MFIFQKFLDGAIVPGHTKNKALLAPKNLTQAGEAH
jgi:hypothetical protein